MIIGTNGSSNTDAMVEQTADSTTSSGIPILLKTVQTSGARGGTKYDTGVTVTPSTHTVTATNFEGNATTATSVKVTTPSSIGTTAGVQFVNATILSQSGNWFIETFVQGTSILQRATSINDPSAIAVRTSANSGTSWNGWVFPYADWHA